MNRLNKLLAFILIAALLVGIGVPSSASAAHAEPGMTIPDGEYKISYRYVKDGTVDISAADSFLLKNEASKLIISNGKAVYEHEVTKGNYATFAYLGARKSDGAKAVITTVNGVETVTGKEAYENITVRDSADPNNVVISYAIEDVWKKQDILMHINDVENYFGLDNPYNHWYNAQLEIFVRDIILPNNPGAEEEPVVSKITEELFAQRIAEGQALLADAVEGDYDGTYPVNSKTKLQAKLELAENLVGEDTGNTDILEAAYKIADQAIKVFQASRITVNKSNLVQWINTATAWIEGKADAGEREAGVPASILRTPVSDREYLPQTYYGPAIGYKGPVTDIKELIAQAQLVVDNEQATQTAVNAMFNKSNGAGDWELYQKKRLGAYDIEIMVLTSLNEDAEISPHAGDISSNAVLIQQAGPGSYQTFANFAFYNTDKVLTDTSIRQVNASGGLFSNWTSTRAAAVKNIDVTNTPIFKSELEGEHADTVKIYQSSTVRGETVTDEIWQGLWKLQYPMELPENERKTVFISFNKAYLDALQQLIDDAQVLVNDAKEGTEVGHHSAYYINQLKAAIAVAQETAGQLAAPRPDILKAEKKLQAVIDTFNDAETKQVRFSAAHNSAEEFSKMNEYFGESALVITDDEGNVHVTLTITSSSNVPEFKVKIGEEFVAATTVSEDKVKDTRVVTFKVNSLSPLLDAKVRTVVPAQNYDRTHDIRLNFNDVDNQKLYELIQTAAVAYKKAVDSGKTGQFNELALTSLSNAIKLANTEAIRIPSAQKTTDEAHLRLSNALETFNKTFSGGDNENPGTDPGTNPGTPIDPNKLENGSYFIDYTVLYADSNKTSMTTQYLVSPALLKVSGGKKTVSLTVLRSKEIVGLTINGSSGSVASSNATANTRVVTFNIDDLSSIKPGWVSINWVDPSIGFKYINSYNIRFQFFTSSIVAVDSNTTVPGGDGNVGFPSGYEDGIGDDLIETDKDKTETKVETEANNNAPAVVFSDTASHWAKDNIAKAVKLGIVNGFADGSFRPNATVTRGEFAVMISRALKFEGNGDQAALTDFAAIPSWAKEHVARIVFKGIIQGYADGTFRSNEQLTRAQLAVIIARAANLPIDKNAVLSFADASQIPSWAQKEVAAAVKAGLILGKENNRFDSNGTATRAEAVTLIIRLLEQASK